MKRDTVDRHRELLPAGTSRRRRLTYSLLASLPLCAAMAAHAQDETPPFGRNRGGIEESTQHWTDRARNLERRFFETDAWTFYHSVADLPPDMRALLSRVAGSDVVGPGEDFDLGDVVRHPGRVQHLYTAVTDDIGVIVWYSGGWSVAAHAVLYDRKLNSACRYNLGPRAGGVLPIKPALRMWIQTRGASQGGCEYLPP